LDGRRYFLSRPYEERPGRERHAAGTGAACATDCLRHLKSTAMRQAVPKWRLEQGLLNAGRHQATTTKGNVSRAVASDAGPRCGAILTGRGACSGKNEYIDGERVLAHRLPGHLAPCTFPYSADPRQTASFSSSAGRNATFLLAAICIISPVAGLRPVRASRWLTANVPRLRPADHALQHDGRRRRPVFHGSLILRR
jgi:hypothetical protein